MLYTSENNPGKNYDTVHPMYHEAAAIQQLMAIVTDSGKELQELSEAEKDDRRRYADQLQFTITILGKVTAFYMGGPQIEALMDFCRHIADENFYGLDFTNDTVDSGWSWDNRKDVVEK